MQQANDRILSERDLYKRLLDLSTVTDVDQFMSETLGLVVAASGARHGYIELRDVEGERVSWTARGMKSDEAEVAHRIVSQGIVAKALLEGECLSTSSARLDPRFSGQQSVQHAEIESVLCIPIGAAPHLGVLYLEGERERGEFSKEDLDRGKLLAKYLEPIARAHLQRQEVTPEADPTTEIRAKLAAEVIVGRSRALAFALRDCTLVAPVDVNVLISGESGTGKSQVARVIHNSGARRSHPFMEINCATLPSELIESELFGSERGAHSTASERREGKIAAAEFGTLFLDEISEIPPEAQAKLLQFLHSGEYFPLGASKARKADVRVIAASNANLIEEVKAKRFREDLYYRLNVVPIRMPPLSERKEDIPLLASALLSRVCKRLQLPEMTLSPNAQAALRMTDWPGNVRQLSNILEAGALRANAELVPTVERGHIFPEEDINAGEQSFSFQTATRNFQRDLLRQTLTDTDWNVTESARRLDIARSHTYNLINAFGLTRE